MILIQDDPIIRSMERTGYPYWFHNRCDDDEYDDEEESEEEEEEEYLEN